MLKSSIFISRLTPLKTILAIHKSGFALADPYLSFATPLTDTKLTPDLFNEHGVGGILHLSQTSSISSSVSIPSHILQTQFSSNLTFQQIQQFSQDDILWEDIDLENIQNEQDLELEKNSNIKAAISLQHFLFTHCGGWANTFG